jgi:hypothetical protein
VARHLAFLLTNMMNRTIFWYRDAVSLSPYQIASLIQTQFRHGAMMAAVRGSTAASRLSGRWAFLVTALSGSTNILA